MRGREIESAAFHTVGGSGRAARSRIRVPVPTGHQVRFRVISTGICRSQLHQLVDAEAASPDAPPRLLGHEALVEVESVGERVGGLRPADLALVTWLPRAGEALARALEPVRIEHPETGAAFSVPDVFTWSEFGICDEAYLVRSPPASDAELAVVGCAVMTGAGAVKNTLAATSGDRVGVIGAGGVGLAAVAAAAALEARMILAVDVDDAKLELARKVGATHTVNSRTEDVIRIVADATGGEGLDLIADCVGARATFEAALAALRPGKWGVRRGGAVALVGVPRAPFNGLDMRRIQLMEQTVLGSFGGSSRAEDDLPLYLEWVAGGRFDLRSLVTDRISFERLPEGLEALRTGGVLGRMIAVLDDAAAVRV